MVNIHKYFLDKNGVTAKRMADGKPGDVYAQMFQLGYARVVEFEDKVMVESPRRLTRAQKDYLDSRRFHPGALRPILLNHAVSMESKSPAAQVVAKILE